MQEFAPAFPHEVSIRIPMHMVDLGNVIYHSRYLDLYHEARDHYLDAADCSYREIMEKNYHLAVADTHIQFKRPIRYLETAIIRTRIAWIRNRSLCVVQEMTKDVNGTLQLCNRAEFTLVCIGPEFKAIRIPDTFIQRLALFQTSA
ncbi:acyl-CoA thioesterase [Desulfobotulus mexicanus]|nr:thioesterase family protein [Desulfobotulus mexicanus]